MPHLHYQMRFPSPIFILVLAITLINVLDAVPVVDEPSDSIIAMLQQAHSKPEGTIAWHASGTLGDAVQENVETDTGRCSDCVRHFQAQCGGCFQHYCQDYCRNGVPTPPPRSHSHTPHSHTPHSHNPHSHTPPSHSGGTDTSACMNACMSDCIPRFGGHVQRCVQQICGPCCHSTTTKTCGPYTKPTSPPITSVPCEGAHFQCFQERAHHGHRLQAVGAKCKDLVKIMQTHTSAKLGCSHWYDTLTLAEGTDQLATLRRDTKLNFVRPKGGNTVALESSFAACGSWGVAKAEKIYALLAFTTPSICLRPNRTPGPPANMKEWETCSVQVGGSDVPDCPKNVYCNHNGHVGKFVSWPLPGRTECYCKYDGGTEGYPCRGNTPCYCPKKQVGPTVAPVEEINLPGPLMEVGRSEYFLEHFDGCPCPDDPKWHGIASTTKSSPKACAEDCNNTPGCEAIYWYGKGKECWLDINPFIVHNWKSFCPEDVKRCGQYIRIPLE